MNKDEPRPTAAAVAVWHVLCCKDWTGLESGALLQGLDWLIMAIVFLPRERFRKLGLVYMPCFESLVLLKLKCNLKI